MQLLTPEEYQEVLNRIEDLKPNHKEYFDKWYEDHTTKPKTQHFIDSELGKEYQLKYNIWFDKFYYITEEISTLLKLSKAHQVSLKLLNIDLK